MARPVPAAAEVAEQQQSTGPPAGQASGQQQHATSKTPPPPPPPPPVAGQRGKQRSNQTLSDRAMQDKAKVEPEPLQKAMPARRPDVEAIDVDMCSLVDLTPAAD
eukprot:3760798-Amphidinium_carterae.1